MRRAKYLSCHYLLMITIMITIFYIIVKESLLLLFVLAAVILARRYVLPNLFDDVSRKSELSLCQAILNSVMIMIYVETIASEYIPMKLKILMIFIYIIGYTIYFFSQIKTKKI